MLRLVEHLHTFQQFKIIIITVFKIHSIPDNILLDFSLNQPLGSPEYNTHTLTEVV